MPPKKKQQEEIPMLGRVKNNLKMGLVGLPNVGKSTLFNLLCQMSIPAENFPFCTIEPSESRCAVPDERYDELCKIFKPASEVPAFLSVTDIAGLVKGASEGAGLGNAFLSHIQAVDGIFHIVRAFDDPDVVHVEGDVNPIADLETIHSELILKDKEWVAKAHDEAQKNIFKATHQKANVKEREKELAIVEKVKACLDEDKDIRLGEWSAGEVEFINSLTLLTAKPVIYLVNLSAADYKRKKNKWLAKIKTWVDTHAPGPIIPFSASYEQELFDIGDEQERRERAKSEGAPSILPKVITTGYHHLKLIHFFTVGPDEVRCWTVRTGTKAPQAAGTIHGDFEAGFIMAETMAYTDFMEHGQNENSVKAAGKYRQEGKNYVVKDGDIFHFKFNAGAGLTKGKGKK